MGLKRCGGVGWGGGGGESVCRPKECLRRGIEVRMTHPAPIKSDMSHMSSELSSYYSKRT